MKNYNIAIGSSLTELKKAMDEAEKDGYVPHGSMVYDGVRYIQPLVQSTKRLDIATQIMASTGGADVQRAYRIADQLIVGEKACTTP